MANDITLFSNVPAHLRDTELSDATKALMGGAGGGGKRISIKGGVFRLMSGGKEVSQIEDRFLDVIIVRAAPHIGRQYYEASYDKDAAATPPDCWSNDGVTPDASSKNRQSDKCATCPQNIAGSGQGSSRACRFQQRLAVMLPDDMEAGVHALTLPATSIFGKAEGDKRPLQDYVRYLAAQTRPVSVEMLITRMKFDTRVESPKLFFSPVRWLNDAEYAQAKAGGDTEEAKRAVTMTVAAVDGVTDTVKPAPMDIPGKPVAETQPEPEAKAPRAARKPKVEEPAEVPETTVDEPEKRKSAKAEKPAAPTKLADVVGMWDDE